MDRVAVVTGAASGIGAATARFLRERGDRVITSDLRDADVLADLATAQGRAEFIEGVSRASGGVVDAVVANAGGGPPETSVQLNFFGTVATLVGLRPLLLNSTAPRAVAVSSIASLGASRTDLIAACLARGEAAALAVANEMREGSDELQYGLALYGNAKLALNRWCRSVATEPEWAGAGILLNVVALGFYDTPSAAYVLNDPPSRAAVQSLIPLKDAFPGRPDDAAALLGWLTGAANTQVTGQVIYADGGFECRARETAVR